MKNSINFWTAIGIFIFTCVTAIGQIGELPSEEYCTTVHGKKDAAIIILAVFFFLEVGIFTGIDYMKSLYKKRNRWIPITERLPDVGVKVLIACPSLDVSTGYYWGEGHKNEPSEPCNGWSVVGVTHWKECPKSPNSEA